MSSGHDNNFDFLRFAAAMSVWFGHGYILAGMSDPLAARSAFMAFGQLGVAIFFVISGYFVTASYANRHSLFVFLKNRALRILPALAVVVFLSALVLGPLVTTLHMHDYFHRDATWTYLKSALIFPLHYDLPGIFTDNTSHAVNGSLWTLKQEVRCYLIVAAMGLLGLLRGRVMLVVLLCLLGIRLFGALSHPVPEKLFHMKWGDLNIAVQLGSLFAAGGTMYLLQDRIPPTTGGFIIACLLVWLSLWLPADLGHILFDMSFGYAVITLGFSGIPGLRGWNNDYSYGIYLYSFPMEQLTLHLMGSTHFTFFMSMSFALTLVCAMMSWHLIEKPALALKG